METHADSLAIKVVVSLTEGRGGQGIRLSGQEGQDMRDGVQACKAMWEGTLLQTWVASVYGVGESGSTLADPNTGPCWSLLLLFSLSEWRLRLILEPRQPHPLSMCSPRLPAGD